MPQPRFPWHVWPGRCWPDSSEQEESFVADLAAAGPPEDRFGRGDVTAVLNALRCGVDLDVILEHTPGVRPGRLLAAYEHLSQRLDESLQSWNAIVADPSLATVTHHGPSAVALLPGIEGPLFQVRVVLGADHLPRHVEELATEVAARCAVAERVEARLRAAVRRGDIDEAVLLGACLYHPSRTSAWSDPLHLPRRVAQLTPTRVADVLGDRRR